GWRGMGTNLVSFHTSHSSCLPIEQVRILLSASHRAQCRGRVIQLSILSRILTIDGLPSRDSAMGLWNEHQPSCLGRDVSRGSAADQPASCSLVWRDRVL